MMSARATISERTPARPVASRAVLSVAYTPDSDDALNFFAWEHGHVSLPGREATFHRDCISVLNRDAAAGRHDVVSISSAFYPTLARDYWILSAGSSVGRGYGPVLVAREPVAIESLHMKRIAVGGKSTTGYALALLYCPEAKFIEMRYDQIADAILAGKVDAGVMIHEELLYYKEIGLHRVCDLGATWCDDTELPLPVGLNVVHRRVGEEAARDIDSVCRQSLQWGLDHLDEAMGFAGKFGRGCAKPFVEMFSNQDTLSLPDDAVRALRVLFDRVAILGLGPRLAAYEVIRG